MSQLLPSEGMMTTWDDTQLFYRSWIPPRFAGKALLLFHRGHEHSGRWQSFIDELALDDVAIFAWDARGHGRSPGERGAAPSFSALVKDLEAFVRSLTKTYKVRPEQMACLGHSLGAVTLATWVHDYAPPLRAMILATAAFRVRLYVPLAIPMLRLKQRTLGPGRVTSYVRAKMLTRDASEIASYESDPLISRQIAVNVLLDMHAASQRLLADAGAIHVPTLLLGAGTDWVVDLKAQREFFNKLSSPVKQMHVFPAARHSIFHDTQRRQAIELVRDFLSERFATATPLPNLRKADRLGYTWEEHERLKLNGKPQYALLRAGLKATGRLSKGIELGWRTGFDSGLSLDYVYINEARGLTSLGRRIDRSYLNSIGWRGIRERKKNLVGCLQRVIRQLSAEGKPVHLLDIAAGAGRYIFDVIQACPEVTIKATLLDYKAENIEQLRATILALGLKGIEARRADAFDRELMLAMKRRPTLAIVSGLYELLPSNDQVEASLATLAEITDGYLVYTNQPWHPQLEFIARVLPNREGKPWIMRRRTTAEMDELVRVAGFEKLEMEIDEWGMFSVSIARSRVVRNGAAS